MSQEAINEILSGGDTSIGVDDIRKHFPTQVQSGGQMMGVEQWNDTQKAFCASNIFPPLHSFILRLASPRAYNVSRDQDLGVEWSSSLPKTGFTVTSVTQLPGAVFAASAGKVFRLDPGTGAVLGSTSVGSDEVRLANDGTSIYAAGDGAIARIAPDGKSSVWHTALPKAKGTVALVVDAAGLFASSNGYLYRLDAGSGSVVNHAMFASLFGTGDYTANLLVVGGDVIVGSHGYVYRYAGDTLQQRWECSLSGAGYVQVDVAIAGATILAATNGYLYTVDAAAGAQRSKQLLTSVVGVGDYTTHVTTDGTTAFVGVHGYVYGVPLANPTTTAWTCSLPDARYTLVAVDLEGGRLYAGSYGYLFRIDPSSGAVVRSMLLASTLGMGDYTTRIAPSVDGRAIVGAHGYAYGVRLIDH
jgi:PQQ-like domain